MSVCQGKMTIHDGVLQCSYCGSLSVDGAIALLKKNGTDYSGSDWKYGWPHKFYIGKFKFYAIHLETMDQCAAWNAIASPLLGIRYFRTCDNFRYEAVGPDYQTWGIVGGPEHRPEIMRNSGPPVPSWFVAEGNTERVQ